MNATYKVKLTPHPIIIRVCEDQEEVIYDRYIKIKVAENLVSDLNKGHHINWDDLN